MITCPIDRATNEIETSWVYADMKDWLYYEVSLLHLSDLKTDSCGCEKCLLVIDKSTKLYNKMVVENLSPKFEACVRLIYKEEINPVMGKTCTLWAELEASIKKCKLNELKQ